MLALNDITASSAGVNVLIKTICFCLLYVNHSINLLLYCFTGRKFRLELKVSFRTTNCKLCPDDYDDDDVEMHWVAVA